MIRSLHDEFSDKENGGGRNDLVSRCKTLLYTTPTGQRLVDVLNLHKIPVTIETAPTQGYQVINRSSILLTCQENNTLLYEMAIHLACGIRAIELHIQTYRSPEMKDSRSWQNAHLTEPFEIMLVICQLAYDFNYFSKNPEVEKFLTRNNFVKIYAAFEGKHSYSHIETLMLESFNTKN